MELIAPYAGSDRLSVARLELGAALYDYLAARGRPIRYSYVPREWPLEAYQTVFAREPGSAEIEIPSESGVLSARGPSVREEGQAEFRFYPDGTNSGGEVRIEKRQGGALTAYVLFLDPLLGTATIWREE